MNVCDPKLSDNTLSAAVYGICGYFIDTKEFFFHATDLLISCSATACAYIVIADDMHMCCKAILLLAACREPVVCRVR